MESDSDNTSASRRILLIAFEFLPEAGFGQFDGLSHGGPGLLDA